jgi:hypothetical protein
MKIWDFKGTYEANNTSEIERVLRKRYGSRVNGFWLPLISNTGPKGSKTPLVAAGWVQSLGAHPR